MNVVRCDLPHPLFIVLTGRCLSKAAGDYPELSFPQGQAQVEADFLDSQDGVLAVVDERDSDDPKLIFCTPNYELVCSLTQQKDAWYALRLSPLGLRTHNLVARGALRIHPRTWSILSDIGELNAQTSSAGGQTGLVAILSVWGQVGQGSGPQVERAEAYAARRTFLANVETLIDLACEVELEQAARQEKVMVRFDGPLSGSLWRFIPKTRNDFRPGDYLQAGSGELAPELDAVVVEARPDALILRFFNAPASGGIEQVKWLIPKVSTRQYAIQREAVQALRHGQSLNPHLLGLLLENRFNDYPAPDGESPSERLNPAQQTLVERALLVPDMLLALGPPGTGKTAAIREIVVRMAAEGKKVLVTSKNNKAVDNVLEGLANVRALRIGREDAVEAAVRPLLVDKQSAGIQARILENLQPVQEGMNGLDGAWPRIQALFARLSELTGEWQSAHDGLEQARLQLTGWQTASYTRVERVIANKIAASQGLYEQLESLAGQAEVIEKQLKILQKPAALPILGVFFTLLADGVATTWQEVSREHQETLQALRKEIQSAREVWESYRQIVTAGEQALGFKRAIVHAETQIERAQEDITTALSELYEISAGLPGAPDQPETVSPSALEALFKQWQTWHDHQAARLSLLREWREMLETRPQALNSTVIRSADVVGATCIGIATDARFEDLDFDLVVADEAGQIQVMDLLVPLVRARRAVLVGDHLQLPPVVEPEVVQKIREREPENQELGGWLEKSLFERLILHPDWPESHKVMLDTQYRMPRAIADFISSQFYGGKYQTGGDAPHSDPIFSTPLVFVDTMKEVRHYEQRAGQGQGYTNPTEARILADLVLAYQSHDVQAGVIVPYRKQAEAIRRELRQRGTGWDEDVLASQVATVDSFQGREQDVVLFGFTRSNPDGRVGFLSELRRLNVSLTRARRQLVLVGDSVTLSNAHDPAFARLFTALLLRVKKTPRGYLSSHEVARIISKS
jgi:KaiC/GvpD/RAD55 family RecA-like ATPase